MEERRNEILRELDRKGRVKVTDLSKEFGCSEVTIRNDIKAMDIEGLLKRTPVSYTHLIGQIPFRALTDFPSMITITKGVIKISGNN